MNSKNIQLFNEDFLLSDKVKNESIDAVITDPPYGIDYRSWDTFENFEEFTASWLLKSEKLLKPNGTAWFFFAPTMIKEIFSAIDQTGFHNKLENWSVWARQKGRGSTKKLKSVREDVFHLVKDSKNYTWNDVRMLREVIVPYVKDGRPRGWFIDQTDGLRKRWTGLGNVWNYSSAFWKSKTDKQIHSAQKPVMMLCRLLLLSSNEGDVVLDPFSGSGSLAIACLLTNRKFIGFEKDKEMYEKSIAWINEVIDSNFENYKEFLISLDRMKECREKKLW